MHEENYFRRRRPDDFGQLLVRDATNLYVLLPDMAGLTRHFQKDTSQPQLTVVEELIAQILFHVDVTRQQRSYKTFGERGLKMNGVKHGALFDSKYGRWFQSCCRAGAESIFDQAFSTEKVMRAHRRKRRLLPVRRDDRELNLASLNKVDSVRFLSLRKECRVIRTLQQSFTLVDFQQQRLDADVAHFILGRFRLRCCCHYGNTPIFRDAKYLGRMAEPEA